MAELAVIIVSYNSASFLGPCLTALYEHAGDVELDVVVAEQRGVRDGAGLGVASAQAPAGVRNERRAPRPGRGLGQQASNAVAVDPAAGPVDDACHCHRRDAKDGSASSQRSNRQSLRLADWLGATTRSGVGAPLLRA
jgi:hypothetical protein